MTAVKFTYDTKNDLGYLDLNRFDAKIAKTVPFDCGKYVDLNASNEIVGIEFVGLPPELDMETLSEVFALTPKDTRLMETVLKALA